MNENKVQPVEKEREAGPNRIAALDTAVLLTLGSGLLYILGWTYWSSFFQYFGVTIEFADIGFNQIVASTWWLAFPFIMFLFELEPDALETGDLNKLSIRVHNVLLVALGIAGGITFSLDLPFWAVLSASVIAFAVFMVCSLRFQLERKRLPLGRFVRTKHQRLLLFFLFLSVAILVYSQLGRHHAKLRAEGRSTDRRITIKASSGGILHKDAILVSHMDGKYFICKPIPEGGTPELLIIEDGEIESVTIK